MPDFNSYQSPFSWRYGSPELRFIWSEVNKRLLWRQLWATLAEVQMEWSLVSVEQAADIRAHCKDVDVDAALQIESVNHHDLMAELKVYAAQCPLGGGCLHLGATSMDIKDNAEVLQIRDSLDRILVGMRALLAALAEKIVTYADLPVMGFTHLQPAEPTTLGYRLAAFAQDLLADFMSLQKIQAELKGKGFKGAVGNAASYVMLYGGEKDFNRFEAKMSQALELPFFEVANQTYTRHQDYVVLSALAALAATTAKFAFDLRLLQSEVIGELGEPFGAEQVGSSAMPFKRNPIEAEKIDSLARSVAAAPLTAWQNYAGSLLERTLDDSANRRTLLPESFLAVAEILGTLQNIIGGLRVNQAAIEGNLNKFGPFAAVERVLMAAVQAGANRQELHEVLRQLSMSAWEEVQNDQANPLPQLLQQDERITRWVKPETLTNLLDIKGYTGIAASRSRELAARIQKSI